MQRIMKRLLVILIVVLGFYTVSAQKNCAEQLRLAERNFEEGLLDDIYQIISPCLKDGFSKDEKVDAYKLLIQTYIFNDMMESADEIMVRFLKEFPEYVLSSNDPREFSSLYNTYRTEPVLKLDIIGGLKTGVVSVQELYGPEDFNYHNVSYNPLPGAYLAVNYSDNLIANYDFSIGANISQIRYGYLNTAYDFTSVNATYNNFYIGMPVSVRYNKSFGKIDAFLSLGVEPVYLLYSKIDIIRSFNGLQDDLTGSEIMTDMHRRYDILPALSVGASYKLGKAYLLFETGFKFGIVNPVINEKRFTNQDLINKFYYVEDDIRVNQLFLSFSYVFSFYKPKKIN